MITWEQKINKIGKTLALQRESNECWKIWEQRVLAEVNDTWDKLGYFEKKFTNTKTTLQNISNILTKQ